MIAVAVWSGRRCSWKQSKIWTHRLQRVHDWCPSLFSPWLTGGMSMWPQSADDSPSRSLTHGLGCCCMIWSAAKENAGACCLVVLVSTGWWCWSRCLLVGDAGAGVAVDAGVWCLLLDDAGTGAAVDAGVCSLVMLEAVLQVFLAVWLAAVLSSCSICKKCSEETRGDPQKTFWN